MARRHVNGYTVGALQIFIDGAFGAVCGASLLSTDAGVACRQMGFVGGGRVVLAQEVLSDAELQVRLALRSQGQSREYPFLSSLRKYRRARSSGTLMTCRGMLLPRDAVVGVAAHRDHVILFEGASGKVYQPTGPVHVFI